MVISMKNTTVKSDMMVIGAGIAGISTALEAAETGYKVVLIEKNPYIGGRVVQLNQYFPKLCPPTCGMEINIRRLRDNHNIILNVMTDIIDIEGKAGDYNVTVRIRPTYINEECPNLDKIASECAVMRKNDFNFGIDDNAVIYMPYNNAYPSKYMLDRESCSPEDLKFLADRYKEAIDLDQKEEIITYNVKSIVWSTGWEPYNANNLTKLGYGEINEVITNIELERIASSNGPYGGKINVPGTDKIPQKVVFVQCAGSRDENHLEYCSSVCCLASIKQAKYILEVNPDADVHIFYIDIRTPGVFEEFYSDSVKDGKIKFHRGKVAKVFKSNAGEIIVEAEDTMTGNLMQMATEMVVLATGMKPNTELIKKFNPDILDKNGFVKTDAINGISGCGVCTRPKDVAGVVQEATGTAMRAIHTIVEAN